MYARTHCVCMYDVLCNVLLCYVDGMLSMCVEWTYIYIYMCIYVRK